MSNALESWSWAGCEGHPADVEVYARGDVVELQLNGKTVELQAGPEIAWPGSACPMLPGTLEAVVYDTAGQETGRNALHTAGKATLLQALPEELSAASGHLVFVRLQYSDEAGTVKPLARGRLKVKVSGGRLLGLGSGCPYNPIGYLSDECDTYYGRALAVVLADGSGPVELTVTDSTLQNTCYVPVC